MDSSKKIGDKGEILAIEYLQRNYYKVLDTNIKFGRFGEIDIVVSKDNITRFVEVKYRSTNKYGTPEESITKKKLFKCKKTIEWYVKKHNLSFEQIAFDVIAIQKQQSSHKLTHYRNIEI